MDTTELLARLDTIEKRLSNLEARHPSAAPPPVPVAPKQAPITVGEWEGGGPKKEYASLPSFKPGNLLGVMAVICFVLAAGFIIKLSIESGWLTPARQIGLAALFGIGLIGAGLSLMKADRAYASFLPSAGTIVLYLAAFGAYRLYGLISFELAIAATSIVSGLCIWLYLKIRHDIYAITAAVGAYVAPLVLGAGAESPFGLYYFVLCSVTFSAISIWVESRMLTIVSAYCAVFFTFFAGERMGDYQMAAIVQGLHFIIFTIGTYLYTLNSDKTLTGAEAKGFFPVLLLFYASEYFFIGKIDGDLASWCSLGFAALMIGIYISARKMYPSKPLESGPVMTAFISMIVFHSAFLELLPDEGWQIVSIALIFAFALLPSQKRKVPEDFWPPLVALLGMFLVGFAVTIARLVTEGENHLTFGFATIAGMWLVLTVGKRNLASFGDMTTALLGLTHILAVMAFYQLTKDIGSIAVSVAWLGYALAVMGGAFFLRDRVMAQSAVVVLGFAAAKALLYDASNAPTLVRIVCLLMTGVVLYGAGFLLRRIAEWKTA